MLQIPLSPLPKISIHELSQMGEDGKSHLLFCTFRIRETGFRFVKLITSKDYSFPFRIYKFSFHGRMENLDINNENY